MPVIVRSHIPADIRKPHEVKYIEVLRRQLELPNLTDEARKTILATLRALGSSKRYSADRNSPLMGAVRFPQKKESKS
jgi:hypothetical protein